MAEPSLFLVDVTSLGLSPLLMTDVFDGSRQLQCDSDIAIGVVEQNARMALSVASLGPIMEPGQIVLDGETATLAENE